MTITQGRMKELFDELLENAEHRYGPRDANFAIDPSIDEMSVPQIVYNGNMIKVAVGRFATGYEPTLIANLAHECIHVLSPTGQQWVSFLEEGIAVLNSLEEIRSRCDPGEVKNQQNSLTPAYKEALDLVKALIEQDVNAPRSIRDKFGKWTNITQEDIQSVVPNIATDKAKKVQVYREPNLRLLTSAV